MGNASSPLTFVLPSSLQPPAPLRPTRCPLRVTSPFPRQLRAQFLFLQRRRQPRSAACPALAAMPCSFSASLTRKAADAVSCSTGQRLVLAGIYKVNRVRSLFISAVCVILRTYFPTRASLQRFVNRGRRWPNCSC